MNWGILLPNLKNSGVNGAVKWINDGRVILAINNRRLEADVFWFSIFHEIRHVLQRKIKTVFISYGEKEMIEMNEKLEEDGSFVPFGTPIENSQGFNVGMADENGLAYLGGIRLGETMIAQLGSNQECLFTFTESNLEKDEDDPIICELNHK